VRTRSDLPLASLDTKGARVYRFPAFELDVSSGELRRGDQHVLLTRQQIALLGALVRAKGRPVSRETLLHEVWDGVVVSEGALRQAVWELRKLLGVDGEGLIEAVRGRGYRLTAAIEPVEHASAPASARAPRTGGSRLLGRERELEQLERMRYDALHRAGRACVLIGPAGVGKSRLVRELVERAALDGVACSESYADRDGALPPLWPWSQLLQACLQDAQVAVVARCRVLGPSVFAWLESDHASAPAWPLHEASERRLHLFEQLSRVLGVLLLDKPRVCLLEDLQWADDTSLAFLAHHARTLTQCRALWLMTCRSTEDPPSAALARALHALEQGPHNQRIELSSLGRDDVAAMLALQLGDAASQPLAEQVHALTRGNPLFVHELSRALVEGAVPRDVGQQQSGPQLDAIALQPVIERRLRRLPQAVLALLQAAAVLARDVTVAELAAVLERAPSDVLALIDEGLESGMLLELGEHSFGFAHPLLQHGAYALLTYGERSRLHGLAARYLESFEDVASPRRLSELAHHFYQAGEGGPLHKALEYSQRAGEAAIGATAYGSAALYFQRAVRCAEVLSECTPAQRIALELSRVEAVHAEHGSDEPTRAAYLRLAERARSAGLWDLYAHAALGYTGHQHHRFVPTRFAASVDPREVAMLEQALAGLGPTVRELRVLTLCSLAYALSGTAELERRRQLLHEAVEQARELGDAALLARTLRIQIYVAAGPDLATEQLAACDAFVELTLRHGLHELELEARIARYLWLFGRGDRAAAMRDVQRAEQLAEVLDTPQARSRAQLPALIDAFGTGRLRDAERLAAEAHAATADDPNQRMIFMMRSASLAMLRGQIDLSQALFGYEQLFAAHPHAIQLRALLASAYATLGRQADARSELDVILADDFAALPADINWLPTMALLADAAVHLDDAARARLIFDRLLPHADAFFFFGVETTPGIAIAMCLGDLAVVLGELERAEQLLDRAQVIHAALGLTLLDQYTALARARLLLATRSPGAPRVALRLMSQVRQFAGEHEIAWLRICADTFDGKLAALLTQS
jgi:DNA-binding winged helix-turn-helix (wHTH) protein